jgi:hypothetical protein
MKIRTNYVSNSSSSSFIIWGNNAKDYVNQIECGNSIDAHEFADAVWWHKICYYGSSDVATFINEDTWLKDFKNNNCLSNKLPITIYESNIGTDLRAYNNKFQDWFYEKFANENIYEIEFSDHMEETKYLEEDMYDVMSDYNGNYITTNNH